MRGAESPGWGYEESRWEGTHKAGDRAPREPGWGGSSVSLGLQFTRVGPTLLLQRAGRGTKEGQ